MNPDGTPKEGENKSFIYRRGNNYYIQIKEEVHIGEGLSNAVENFSLHTEWQRWIAEKIRNKEEEVGFQKIHQDLTSKFLPVLERDYERAEKGGERKKILLKFKDIIERYLKEIERTV